MVNIFLGGPTWQPHAVAVGPRKWASDMLAGLRVAATICKVARISPASKERRRMRNGDWCGSLCMCGCLIHIFAHFLQTPLAPPPTVNKEYHHIQSLHHNHSHIHTHIQIEIQTHSGSSHQEWCRQMDRSNLNQQGTGPLTRTPLSYLLSRRVL